jgi:hypothetical protein
MSAHLGDDLNIVDFVKNPMYITVDGTNEFIQMGSVGFFQIEAATSFTPGCSIRFSWPACPLPNNTLIMTCALMPDDSGQQYNTTYFVPVMDMLTYALPYFLSNYYLSRDFNIMPDMTSFPNMLFSAKNIGPEYNLVITTDDPNLFVHTTNCVPRLVNPNYNLRIELFVCDNSNPFMGNFHRLPALKHKPNVDGFAEYDLSPLLEPWVLPLDTNPVILPLSSVGKRIYGAVPYFIEFFEEYGNPSMVKKKYRFPADEGYMFFMPGGLSKDDVRLADNLFGSNNHFDIPLFLNETGSLVTPRPTFRFISQDTPDFASFYIPNLGGNVYTVWATVYYIDGSTEYVNLQSIHSIEPYTTVTFTTGFNQNNLNMVSLVEAYKYEIYLADEDNNVVAGPMCYTLMQPEAHKYMFLYVNSFGRWEVLECRSRRVEILEKVSEEIRPVQSIPQTKHAAEIAQHSINTFPSYELSSGALASKKDANALKDFIQSEHIYEIYKKPNSSTWNYVKCLVNDGKFDIYTDGDGFPNIKFGYRHASDEQSFSDILV